MNKKVYVVFLKHGEFHSDTKAVFEDEEDAIRAVKRWNDLTSKPAEWDADYAEANFIGKIEYTTLSGLSRRISDEFQMNAMGLIWHMYLREENPKLKSLLDEIHCVLSAVLYGTITKEGK